MPFASCLALQGVVAACSACKSSGVTAISLCHLVHCFGILQPLYAVHICNAYWDSLSVLVHSGTL